MLTILSLLASAALVFIIHLASNIWTRVRSIQDHPGFRILFAPSGIFSYAPRTRGIFLGRPMQYTLFKELGIDIISTISVFPQPQTNFFLADAAAIKEIMSNRFKFPKPLEMYKPLEPYGPHIVASDYDEWKRYRKVCAPAFAEPNNKLVWAETVRIVEDLIQNVWKDQRQIVYDHVLDLTMPAALFVISAAGFGRRLGWNDELIPPKGHTMTFKDALAIVSYTAVFKASIPKWILLLSERGRKTLRAYDELEVYMNEIIQSRRTHKAAEIQHDLLSNLLNATEDDFDGYSRLTDKEVLGNIFIFLIAGHETSAHTLAFALALLALHMEEQDRLYDELLTAFPDHQTPSYADVDKLSYVECVLNETLRLYPPVSNITKETKESTSFTTLNAAGEEIRVPVPAGARLGLAVNSLHYNPRYWADPGAFRPARFLEDWPRDAFIPFSGGVRSCLGRRFAELENMVFLSMLIMRYRVEIKPEPQFALETFEQKRERILRSTFHITMAPTRVPLIFTRRDDGSH